MVALEEETASLSIEVLHYRRSTRPSPSPRGHQTKQACFLKRYDMIKNMYVLYCVMHVSLCLGVNAYYVVCRRTTAVSVPGSSYIGRPGGVSGYLRAWYRSVS